MAKVAGLNDTQRKSLKRFIDQAYDLGVTIKTLTTERDKARKEVELLMKSAGVEVAEADHGQASYVAGATKRTLDKGKLVKKLKYTEYVEVSEPQIGRVEALLTKEEMDEIVTETTGEPYVRIDAVGAKERG